MIKHTLRPAMFVLAIACATAAFADPTFTQTNGDTHSQVRDKSNIIIDDAWKNRLQTGAGDPDLYINNMVITGGPGYNPLIGMQTNAGSFDYFDNNANASNTYTFGTAIGAGNDWNFNGAFHNGNINAAVADGIYDFSLDFMGGGNNVANNLLASFGLHVDVFQKIDLTTTTVASPTTIKEGGPGTEVSMTVTNNMTGRNFTTRSWYVSSFSDGLGNNLAFDGFSGNWFDQVLTPGSSRTDSHSLWHADLNTPIGHYTGFNGVIGDVHDGDFIFMNTDRQAEVDVLVPEPASFAVLGVGALALLRRRRK